MDLASRLNSGVRCVQIPVGSIDWVQSGTTGILLQLHIRPEETNFVRMNPNDPIVVQVTIPKEALNLELLNGFND